MTQTQPAPSFNVSASAFRQYFSELRETYLERETLFTQIELALLCREHVLVIGPPGTAKSAIATSVLGRLVDEVTGQPSLFSKQISESTVQTDLIGPVDFKVLTETGRTEYLTEDGMLGASHAFLDEVFDGRDMLLRSILNVLHERELKHGRRVTKGQCECAIMTSNRYLSEVLARSPDLLLPFTDRLAFICFCPKGFARGSSRASMLQRFARGQRPVWRSVLTLQQLDVLQTAVEQVTVTSQITEGLELLADALERALRAQVLALPDYVPTKYFSQRSVVKALWALKAAVVRDKIFKRPHRALQVQPEDLESLRYFFLLGGPAVEDLDLLRQSSEDPRDQAQLEILRVEHRAFETALAQVQAEGNTGLKREAERLAGGDEQRRAEELQRFYQPAVAKALAESFREKLIPGPRHPENRRTLVAAARALGSALEQKLALGAVAGSPGGAESGLLTSFSTLLELFRELPELDDKWPALVEGAAGFARQSLEMIALSSEGSEFEGTLPLDGLTSLAHRLDTQLGEVDDLIAQLSRMLSDDAAQLRAEEETTRQRVARSLRRRASAAFRERKRSPDPAIDLASDSRELGELEASLSALSADQKGLREELLVPVGSRYAEGVLTRAEFTRVGQYARVVERVADNLRREGVAPEPVLLAMLPLIERRLTAFAAAIPGRGLETPSVPSSPDGAAYQIYRQQVARDSPEGELAALLELERVLPSGSPGLSAALKASVAEVELGFLERRLAFLQSWWSQLLASFSAPEKLLAREDAERSFDRLVQSRFPMLATREGELLHLRSWLEKLQKGDAGTRVEVLLGALVALTESFGAFSQRLLEVRAAL